MLTLVWARSRTIDWRKKFGCAWPRGTQAHMGIPSGQGLGEGGLQRGMSEGAGGGTACSCIEMQGLSCVADAGSGEGAQASAPDVEGSDGVDSGEVGGGGGV